MVKAGATPATVSVRGEQKKDHKPGSVPLYNRTTSFINPSTIWLLEFIATVKLPTRPHVALV